MITIIISIFVGILTKSKKNFFLILFVLTFFQFVTDQYPSYQSTQTSIHESAG